MCYRQLPRELRLRGIQTIEEANRFPGEPALPSLFAAFKWRRHSVAGSLLACLDSQNLDLIFSLQFQRMGNRDHTRELSESELADRAGELARVGGRLILLCRNHMVSSLIETATTIGDWHGIVQIH